MEKRELLKVKNLSIDLKTKSGDVKAVRDISFNLAEGETIVIAGESGCGKSTAVKSIMQLNPGGRKAISEDTEIIYRGRELTKLKERDLNKVRGMEIAMIFQNPSTCLDPTMNIGSQIVETIRIHNRLRKRDALKRAVDLLAEVGISYPEERLKQYPHELSGGMAQRVMIAMALSCSPNMLIADEPTTALDVTTQGNILGLLKKLQRDRGMGLILVTHDLGIAWEIADKVQIMYAGEIVESGSKDEVLRNPKHPYTMSLIASIPKAGIEAGSRLYSLEGAPPDLTVESGLCEFMPRCGYCMKICKKYKPEVFKETENHSVSCWLRHPLAQAGKSI